MTTTMEEKFYEGGERRLETRGILTLPISDGLTSGWSPRKLSNTANEPPRSPARRKLSESRGVNLPDIKLHPETFTLTHTEDNIIETPLPTASPLSRFNLQPFDIHHSPRSHERKMKEIIDICLFLPDRSGLIFKVEGGRVATADQLLRLVYEHLGMNSFGKADQLFGLWMCSPLLEIQMKPHHCPFAIRLQWREMLQRFTTASEEERLVDEPIAIVRRNVYLSKKRQMQLARMGDVETDLLFRDAKECIMNGLYPCPFDLCSQLAAYDMALSWGPYNSSTHTAHFVRDKMDEILPSYQIGASKRFSLFGWSIPAPGCRGLENHLLDAYKAASGLSAEQLKWEYLTTCMKLPVYGAAFFNGQIERPAAFGGCAYSCVVVAISREYLCVVDPSKHVALLTMPVEDCSWQKIHQPTESELQLPSFYIHFSYPDERHNDEERSRLIQIFSKQSVMMDALLNSSMEIRNQEFDFYDGEDPENDGDDEADTAAAPAAPGQRLFQFGKTTTRLGRSVRAQLADDPMYKSKLSRLCTATIDSNGKCLDARGLLKTILDGPN